MEKNANNNGLNSQSAGIDSSRQSNLWRPWHGDQKKPSPTTHLVHVGISDEKQPKAPPVIHPVKLFWPKARCFDYLYRDAERLLWNYPVQATICPYEESSTDEEDDDEEEEETEKQQD